MRFGYENDCAAVVDYSEVTVRGFDGLTVPHLERWCMGGSGDFRDLAAPPSISTKVEDTYEQHLNYAKVSYVEIILIQVNSLKLDEHVGKSGSNSLDPQSCTKVN